jgi:hypothetical protein
VWLVVLALCGAVLYVNQVGLPGFAKRRLLGELRDRGIQLQFERLRWRWQEGLVAENVRFGSVQAPDLPETTADEVRVRVNTRELLRGRGQVDGLTIRGGRVEWNVAETNEPPKLFSVEKIQTELSLLPQDTWMLSNLKATMGGVNFSLSGTVSNASALQRLREEPRTPDSPTVSLRKRLKRLAEVLDKIEFSSPPEVLVQVQGDGANLETLAATVMIAAKTAHTPWGSLNAGRMVARLFPATNDVLSHARIKVEAAGAQTRWASITNLTLNLKLASLEGQCVQGDIQLSARQVRTSWASGDGAEIEGQWIHSLTNPVPLTGSASVSASNLVSRWARARVATFSGLWAAPPDLRSKPVPQHGWWTNVTSYKVDWEAAVAGLVTTQAVAQEFRAEGHWHTPDLSVTSLEAAAYGGQVSGQAALNIDTRELNATLALDADAQQLKGLLAGEAQRWLNQFTWTSAPSASATARLRLPAWTNAQPNWSEAVVPTLVLDGQFDAPKGGTYRGLQVTGARGHFHYSNMVWHLPDLHLERPEGTVDAEHRASDVTKDYYWNVRASIDPQALRPALDTNVLEVLDLLTFGAPPHVQAEIWGRYHVPEKTGARATLAVTNIGFRSEHFSVVTTSAAYTNGIVTLTNPYIRIGEREARAPSLVLDFPKEIGVITNAESNIDPMVIVRCIGPETARTLAPYRFDNPPTGRVNGIIPLRGEDQADLRFELAGGPFHWWKFNVPQVAGTVHWQGKRLALENLRIDFYGGRGACDAKFQFLPGGRAIYGFNAFVTNAVFPLLVQAITGTTNQLEGLLSGELYVTHADTISSKIVDGHGRVLLKDGLIWDIPIFGIFSPVLNGIAPGLGNMKGNDATGTFIITNAVIFSNDLDIRSTRMRLAYRGTVDLEAHINAKVEASLFKDTWLVGPVLSTVFWPMSKLFEYKVTGTLEEPKVDPVYLLPKLVLLPFSPSKWLVPERPPTATTNSPPTGSPEAPPMPPTQ